MSSKLDKAREVLRDLKPGVPLKLIGYVSKSEGTTGDYVLTYLGPNGYDLLVETSLKVLEGNSLTQATPLGISDETWRQAIEETKESFRKRLASSPGESSGPSRRDPVVMGPGGIFHDPSKPGTVYIKYVLVVSEHLRGEVVKKEPKGEVPKAKAKLKELLPIGGYRQLFALTEESFEDLQIVNESPPENSPKE